MADDRFKPKDEDEDEDDEIDDTTYKGTKDAVLFAIEISQSMLESPPISDPKKGKDVSPASAALQCAYALMQQRIISNPGDMMGILLYGTEQTKYLEEDHSRSGLSYPNCYLLADLDIPSAVEVKALRNLVEDEEEYQKLMVPSKEPVSMANVLFCANQIFTTKAPNFASRRLFLVTNDDDPHAKDKAIKQAAAVRAKDLYDLGVTIELFPISKLGEEFNRSKFYEDIIYNISPTDPDAPAPLSQSFQTTSGEDGITLLNSLLSSINSRAPAKRAIFSNLPLEIGPGFKISVKGYIIFKRQEPKRSCYIWLGGPKALIAEGVTTQLADDSGRIVDKKEVKKAYKFGGEQVLFTPDEISSLRHFGEPGIRIIGFKPISMIPIWANMKTSTFIYPSEDDYVGSTRVFSALQQKLLEDQKVGIAWFIARKNATPVVAAIFPGAERLSEEGDQIIPPGLWLVPLPFADDIRQNPETSQVPAPDSLTTAMRQIIKQLQLPRGQYNPEKYPNPSLQWHYSILQALALDEDLPEKSEDKTIPRYKQIHKRAGEYAIGWAKILEAEYQHWQRDNRSTAKTTLAKRPASSAIKIEGEPAAKKAKTGDDGSAPSDVDIKRHFDGNTIGKCTIPILKSWLKTKKLDVSGKKPDLVARVEGYFETK